MTMLASKKAIALFTILASFFLLFHQLGNYSLWDDETMVALVAKGVLKTGDTSALLDNGNIVAYRSGLLLHHNCDRSTPPLATYCTAISFTLFGESSWSARLPFALFGLATIVFLLYWARNQPLSFFALMAMGILCNVTFFLQFRQCRYYAPSIFFTTVVVYCYSRWRSGLQTLGLMAVASIALFFANYLNFVVLYCCMGLDYLIWKRKESPFHLRDYFTLFLPQIVVCGLAALVWNPFKTGEGGYSGANGLSDRLQLMYWYFRDLNVCEYYSLAIVIAAVAIGFSPQKRWLLRGATALGVFVVLLSLLSPQIVSVTRVADVRYAGSVLPLGIFFSVGVIDWLTRSYLKGRAWCALALGAMVFGTNITNGNLFERPSTIVAYIRELLNPPPEPYRPTADWINMNVQPGESVYVAPDYATYPLMFHAPKALYAWQLNDHHDSQFNGLPAIHFKGEIMPDYLIGFGPYVRELAAELQNCSEQKAAYQNVAYINVFWKDLYRPELFWRRFEPIRNLDPQKGEGIYIFKRIDASAATAP